MRSAGFVDMQRREQQKLVGFLDRFEQGDGFVLLAGWVALASGSPAILPVTLTFETGHSAMLTRFFYREDVRREGIADGECGFVVIFKSAEPFTKLPGLAVTDANHDAGVLNSGQAHIATFSPVATLEILSRHQIVGTLIDPRIWLGACDASLVLDEELRLPLVLQPQDLSNLLEVDRSFGDVCQTGLNASFSLSLADLEQHVRQHGGLHADGLPRSLSTGSHSLSLLSGASVLVRETLNFAVAGKGRIESFRDSAMIGWAAGRDTAVPVDIEILWDGIRYARIKAGDRRDDLIKKGIVQAGGGFRFQFRTAPGRLPTGQVSAMLANSEIRLDESCSCEMTLPLLPSADLRFLQVDAEAKHLPIAIVVPIYNAAADLRRCLASLERHVTTDAFLILIDDCSPDPEVRDILEEWVTRPHVLVIRNERNLGFSGTINVGISAAGRSDVVLLNSDTIVTSRWLEKLRQAAYSSQKIATVTALSNNSGAFSVPEIGSNVYSDWLDVEAVGRLIQNCAGALYPEVPTGNGFCMYVRRDCLDMVGLMDAEAFPRGYGEENDFCMRALRKGFRNIVDDRTFVYHKRSASFGDEKVGLYERGREIIASRYPEYARLTPMFAEDPVFLSLRWRVRKALAEVEQSLSPPLPRVLFVISTRTGGTPQTNQDLMGDIGDRYETWLLRCDTQMVELSKSENGKNVPVESRKLRRPIVMSMHRSEEYEQLVAEMLILYSFDLVHIRHIAWHSLSLPDLCHRLRVPVIFSFHDFYTVCPTVKLLDDEKRFCAGRCTPTQGECKAELWPASEIPPLKHRFVQEWQARMNEALSTCDAFVTTSPYAADLLAGILPVVRRKGIEVIPHGRSFREMGSVSASPSMDETLRILMPGNINPAKGSDLCEALLALPGRREVEFHIMGDAAGMTARPGLVLHGSYKRDDFLNRSHRVRPHVGAVLSIWPETYCHTLTEMWAAGLPVVAVDLGAVGERIRQHGGGWLISPDADVGELNDLLRRIRRGQADYARKREDVLRWQTGYGRSYTTQVMADRYDLLYRRLERRKRTLRDPLGPSEDSLVAVMSQFNAASEQAPASAHIRVGETTRNNSRQPLLFRHWRSLETLALPVDPAPAAVLVQRDTLDPEDVPSFIRSCRARGIRIVLDCDDDLLSVPEDKDPDGRYRYGRAAFTQLLRSADLVTVSTPALAELFAEYSKTIRVVPNTLSARLWLKPLPSHAGRETSHKRTVALYMGTATHDADLQMLREPVRRIRELHPGFELLVIGGQRADEDWFTRIDGPTTPKNYTAFVEWFRAQCRRADFALGMLADNPFNRCKSDLKFLDYSAAGLPGLYSDVEAYRSAVSDYETGLLLENTVEAWVGGMIWMIENPRKRRRIASRALAAVREARMSLMPGAGLHQAILEQLRQPLRFEPAYCVETPAHMQARADPVPEPNTRSLVESGSFIVAAAG